MALVTVFRNACSDGYVCPEGALSDPRYESYGELCGKAERWAYSAYFDREIRE